MERCKVDVVICTKDRYGFLVNCVDKVRRFVPVNNLIIVDSTEKPNIGVLEGLGAKLFFTPNVKVGYARQVGLKEASTRYVLCIDDDVTLTPNCFPPMVKSLEDSNVLGVSGRVVYGWKTDKILFKLFSRSPSRHGGSGGFVLFKTKEVLALGGYNKNMHWGEDLELCYRIENRGFRWVRSNEAIGFHPLTFKEYLGRAKKHGRSMRGVWESGTSSLFRLMSRFYVRFLVMPLYYTFSSLDPRVFGYYSLFTFIYLVSFLTGSEFKLHGDVEGCIED